MWEEIEECIKDLNKTLTSFKKYKKEYAEKERIYRQALAKKILELRTSGFPVTIISDLARGDEEIAKLRYEKDIAESLSDSAEQGINFYKLKLRTLESQYSKEWDNQKFL